MRRRYILIISLAIFIIVLACSPLGDVDTWFHLKTGQLIYENHSIPQEDIFSHTANGKDWITHEWLFQLFAYIIYLIGGINFLIIMKILVICALFVVLWEISYARRLNTIVNTFFLAVFALLAQGRFSERPQIFSYLFFAGVLKILFDYRDFQKNRLYLLPIIMIFWANIHSAFIFGIAAIGLFLIIESITQIKFDKKLWIYGIAGSLITVINPHGFSAFLYPFQLAGSQVFKAVIVELQSPYHPVNSGASFVLMLNIFIALWVASLAIQIVKKRLDITAGIISLLFLVLTFMASRNRVLFGIATLPFMLRGFKGIPLWTAIDHKKAISRFYWGLGIFTAVLLIFSSLEFAIHGYPMGRGMRQKCGLGIEDWVPQKAANFIKTEAINGKMFNDMTFGGYLIWELYPEKKVFIDGRNLVYGDEIYRHYWQISRQSDAFRKLMDFYGVDFFVLRTLPKNADKATYVHSFLSDSDQWLPVFWDDVSIIYVENKSLNQDVIRENGYKFIDPIADNYLQKNVDPQRDNAQIAQELDRMMASAENSVFANIIAAKVYGNIGEFEKALEHYQRLSELDPTNPFVFRNLGILYYHYKYFAEAEEAFQKALKFDDENSELYVLLGTTYFDNQQFEQAIESFENALKYGKNNGEVLLNIALSYQALNQNETAEEYFGKVIDEFSGTPAAQVAENYQNLRKWKAHLAKAEEYKQEQKLYNAIEEYQIALAAKPDDITTLINLSNLYWRTGNQTKALQTCLRATQIDSTSAAAYNNLGVIYAGMGNRFKAKEAWEKAVEIDPESPAKENLERLSEE